MRSLDLWHYSTWTMREFPAVLKSVIENDLEWFHCFSRTGVMRKVDSCHGHWGKTGGVSFWCTLGRLWIWVENLWQGKGASNRSWWYAAMRKVRPASMTPRLLDKRKFEVMSPQRWLKYDCSKRSNNWQGPQATALNCVTSAVRFKLDIRIKDSPSSDIVPSH